MARINLLPWREELRAQKKKNFIGFLILSGVVGVVTILLVYLQIEAAITYQQGRNKFISDEISVLNKKIKEIEDLKKRKQMMIERMKVIQGLQGTRPVIVRVFDEIVRTIPDGVYLTSLEMKNKKIDIKGVSESNNRVSSFMRKLDQSDWFKQPNLASVKVVENNVLGAKASEFDLSLHQSMPNALEDEE